MVKKAAHATHNRLLRAARKERGWTQQQVADRIGAPLSLNISRWENGTAFPSAYYVERLCQLFGKSIGELGLSQLDGETQVEHAPQPISVKQTPPSVVRETGQGVMTGQSFVASTPEISEGIYRADLLTFRDDTLPRKDLRSQEEEDGGSAWPGQSLAWGGLHSLNRGMRQLVPCLRKASHSFMQWATRCSQPSTWRVWQV